MSSANSEGYDATYWMAPARNFRTSARLHLQHFLFQSTLDGLILEPRILETLPVAASDAGNDGGLMVADLGCGNGAWLLALDRQLASSATAPGGSKKSWKLHGYDFNPINFPPAHTLPETVTLTNLDVLASPLPAGLAGTYDVVHIRAFISLVLNNDPAPILKQAFALLKPGGWLQWEESRHDNYTVEAPPPPSTATGTSSGAETSSSSVDGTACKTIAHMLIAGGQATGYICDFMDEVSVHLEAAGFTDVRFEKIPHRRADLKGWTEDYLMVWEELVVLFPSRAQAPEAPVTKESYNQLFAGAVAETEKGVLIHQKDIHFASARKAL
ncbi:S-adenosyl-L-methionine-dependent methyltransferase [Xylariales sp. PMI_506]|nr:S-adenosyl-L-methionine-dependent methyltransferase [Xylariales sp. PMI_506]